MKRRDLLIGSLALLGSAGLSEIVLRRTVDVSKSQIAMFRQTFPMNARPAKPVGARLLLSS